VRLNPKMGPQPMEATPTVSGRAAVVLEEVLQRQHGDLLQHLDEWLQRVELKLTNAHEQVTSSGTLSCFRRERLPTASISMGLGIEAPDLHASPSPMASPVELPTEHQHVSLRVPSTERVLSSRLSRSGFLQSAFKQFQRGNTQEMRYKTAKERGTVVEDQKNMALGSQEDGPRSWIHQIIHYTSSRCAIWSQSLAFNIFFALVIITNAIFMGIQLEWSVANMDMSVRTSFLLISSIYALLFSVEMFIRICAVGPLSYFCSSGCGWNWLDVLVVVPAWVELAISLGAFDFGGGGSASQFRIVRIFKVTRLLQVVRSIRLVRFLSALRALVLSVVDTTRQLLWALILLGLVQYSFGIMFTDAVLDYQLEHGEDPVLKQYFGTVYASVSTLFRAILGGIDWELAADALEAVGTVWVQLFHLYIAFCGFAVLNVMTGVFVNSAIKTRERDHETLIQNKQKFTDLVQKIWKKMDTSGLGEITIIEFERMFDDEEMKAFFQSIEINAVDAWTLFDSLDVNGDHTISLEEFSERCIQLHGPARSVDLYALKKELRMLEENTSSMNQQLTEVLHQYLGGLTRKRPEKDAANLLPDKDDSGIFPT